MYHFINQSQKKKKKKEKKKNLILIQTQQITSVTIKLHFFFRRDNKITWSSKLNCKDLNTFLALDYNSRDILISRL